MENSIKEAIERLKLCSTFQCNICGRYEKEECMLERNRCEQHILLAYKRVLKENEILKEEKESLEATLNDDSYPEKYKAYDRERIETINIYLDKNIKPIE